LRAALLQFRKAGKKSLFFCESFGEWSKGHLKYYVASAFEEIYMPQSGNLILFDFFKIVFLIQS